MDLDVSAEAGVIRLAGTVDTLWKKGKAEELVSHLHGVTEVDNRLAVAPTDNYSDKSIANDIVAALERDRSIDAAEITVRVEDGHVTLVGSVSNPEIRSRAYNVAVVASGVATVDNRIGIPPWD